MFFFLVEILVTVFFSWSSSCFLLISWSSYVQPQNSCYNLQSVCEKANLTAKKYSWSPLNVFFSVMLLPVSEKPSSLHRHIHFSQRFLLKLFQNAGLKMVAKIQRAARLKNGRYPCWNILQLLQYKNIISVLSFT